MPEAVVDDFESVEIQEQERKRMMAVALCRRIEPKQVIQKQGAIGQARETVVKGTALELRLDAFALGDIDHRDEQSGAGRRVNRVETDFHREFSRVLAQTVELLAAAHPIDLRVG